MRVILSMLIALLLAGCGATVQYDLSTVPTYNQELADERYAAIGEADQKYDYIVMMSKMLPMPDEATIKAVLRHQDNYLYWAAVATVHLFNSAWDASADAATRAHEQLDEILKLLTPVIEGQST